MNVLIFGANGNIGKQLAKKFIKNSKIKKIFCFDLQSKSNIKSRKIIYFKFSNLIINNLIVNEKINVAIFASFIMNFQSAVSKLKKKNYLLENIKVFNLGLDFILKNKINKLIYLSSVAVYGDQKSKLSELSKTIPSSIYGYTKLYLEKLIIRKSQEKNFKYLILRLPHIYGPEQKNNFVYYFLNSRNKISINGDGNQIRNLLHIHDLYRFMIKAINFKKNNILNICNEQLSLNQIIKIIGIKVKYGPAITEPKNQIIDGIKAKKLFRWKPIINFKRNYKIAK